MPPRKLLPMLLLPQPPKPLQTLLLKLPLMLQPLVPHPQQVIVQVLPQVRPHLPLQVRRQVVQHLQLQVVLQVLLPPVPQLPHHHL